MDRACVCLRSPTRCRIFDVMGHGGVVPLSLPSLSQPTLSRYEVVGRLSEKDVRGKGVTEVYRILGIVPPKAAAKVGRRGAAARTCPPTHAVPTRGGTSKPVPVGEPDSVLKRVATVATLVRSLVDNLADLDTNAED